MFDRLVALDRNLTEQQKVTFGAAGMVLGVALIGVLAFAGITSLPMQIAIAFPLWPCVARSAIPAVRFAKAT